jgi:hypothetical protein
MLSMNYLRVFYGQTPSGSVKVSQTDLAGFDGVSPANIWQYMQELKYMSLSLDLAGVCLILGVLRKYFKYLLQEPDCFSIFRAPFLWKGFGDGF